ncbi:MAG TPA: POTRA domain-containing protein [Candidatus Acidoferrales bacterium]|nr:POTRA domain-containing protein [Candidatus Acidoferrales bacterium]
MSFRRAWGPPAGAAALLVLLLSACATGFSQGLAPAPEETPGKSGAPDDAARPVGNIQQIEFVGLQRIAAATLRAHITSREGQPLDPARIRNDVRALDRLGWFDSVSVVVEEIPALLADLRLASAERTVPPLEPFLRVLFLLEERPFLAGVEFRGSHVLSREHIRALLAEKGVRLREAAPANPTELWRARRGIERGLADAGYPRAHVEMRLEAVPTAAVRALFEIRDGPRITVARVTFAGNHAFSDRRLERQMKRVTPQVPLAGLRGKTVYTPERLEEDLERLENFYRNHGYPEARVGHADVQVSEMRARGWLPWPHRRSVARYQILIPVEEGKRYRWSAVTLERELGRNASEKPSAELTASRHLKPGAPYSQQELERAREMLERVKVRTPAETRPLAREVDAQPAFDPATSTVRVTFRIRETQPYTVRHIEFLGERRFSDRYYRRRILLKEGESFHPEKLEQGLAQLARAGFVRPPKPEDVHVHFDERSRTADVTIRVEEIGRQRISLVGGHGQFGSTVGLAYNLFDLLGGEELITGHLEGGPESLQALLGVAKEGLFGTRASLGLSLFQNVIRPSLPGQAGRQRLFTSRSSGVGLGWTYPVTPHDSLGFNYQLSETLTKFDVSLPSGISGLPGSPVRASTSSRSIGLRETRDTGRTRLEAAASVSGGWLGGSENLLRSSFEYSRLTADPLSDGRNTWAFRGTLAGVSSYHGELPLHARLFGGDQFVRGFRTGELTPYALAESSGAQGTAVFQAQSPGADLVGAVNSEYRVPLVPRAEVAGFFDAGSGWLLPGWLGPNRPTLLRGTNGIPRASTGLELRWRLPVIEHTLRVHYSWNPLRLRETLSLPDGSRFRPPDRHAALGWALGSLF